MDKYEFKLSLDEINHLIQERRFEEAANIADTIDWNHVRSTQTLGRVSEVYKIVGDYERSRDVMEIAYLREPENPNVVYSLCELSFHLYGTGALQNDYARGLQMLQEYQALEPSSPKRLILQYRMYDVSHVSDDEKITVLEQLRREKPSARWEYELAKLYASSGDGIRAAALCTDIMEIFGGKYGAKAQHLLQQLQLDQQTEPGAAAVDVDAVKAVLEEDVPRSKAASAQAQAEASRGTQDASVRAKSGMIVDAAADASDEFAERAAVGAETDGSVQESAAPGTSGLPEEMERAGGPAVPDESTEYVNGSDVPGRDERERSSEPAVRPQSAQEALQQTPVYERSAFGTMDPATQAAATPTDVPAYVSYGQNGQESPVPMQDSQTPSPSYGAAEASGSTSRPGQVTETETSISEVMAEWERIRADIRRANDEKRTQRIMQDTGSILQSFDETARHGLLEDIEKGVARQRRHARSGRYGSQDMDVRRGGRPYEEPGSYEEQVYDEGPAQGQDPYYEEEPVSEQGSGYYDDEPASEQGSGYYDDEPVSEQGSGYYDDEPVSEPASEYYDEEPEGEPLRTPAKGNVRRAALEPEDVRRAVSAPAPEEEGGAASDAESKTTPVQRRKPSADAAAVSQELIDEFSEPGQGGEEPSDSREQDGSEAAADDRDAGGVPLHNDDDDTRVYRPEASGAATRRWNAEEVHRSILRSRQKAAQEPPERVLPEEEPVPSYVPGHGSAAVQPKEQALEDAFYDELEDTPQAGGESAFEEPIHEESDAPAPAESDGAVPADEEGIDTARDEWEEPVPDGKCDVKADRGKRQDEFSTESGSETSYEEEPSATSQEDEGAEPAADAADAASSDAAAQKGRRELTRDERRLFGPFCRMKDNVDQLTEALEQVSLSSTTGNLLILGNEATADRVAKGILDIIRRSDPNFTGRIARASGEALNRLDAKGFARTFGKLESGALIVTHAADIAPKTMERLYQEIEGHERGLILILTDGNKKLEQFRRDNEKYLGSFTAVITIKPLDDKALVSYAKDYALSQDYSIDEFGQLALAQRISSMQTQSHHVTLKEVRDLVDEAISYASKKNLNTLMEIITRKRYDEDDRIILHEKDFSHY